MCGSSACTSCVPCVVAFLYLFYGMYSRRAALIGMSVPFDRDVCSPLIDLRGHVALCEQGEQLANCWHGVSAWGAIYIAGDWGPKSMFASEFVHELVRFGQITLRFACSLSCTCNMYRCCWICLLLAACLSSVRTTAFDSCQQYHISLGRAVGFCLHSHQSTVWSSISSYTSHRCQSTTASSHTRSMFK